MAQGADFFPIPGTRSADKLEQNLGALGITVTPDEDSQIRDIIGTLEIVGSRSMALGTARAAQLQDTVPLSS